MSEHLPGPRTMREQVDAESRNGSAGVNEDGLWVHDTTDRSGREIGRKRITDALKEGTDDAA